MSHRKGTGMYLLREILGKSRVTGWSTEELWAIGKYFSRFLLNSTHCRSSHPYHLWLLWWIFVTMNYVSLNAMFIFLTSVWKFCFIYRCPDTESIVMLSLSDMLILLTSVWTVCLFSTGVLTLRALLRSFGVLQKCLQIDRLAESNGITWSLKMCLSDSWKCCHLIYARDFFNCEIFQIN